MAIENGEVPFSHIISWLEAMDADVARRIVKLLGSIYQAPDTTDIGSIERWLSAGDHSDLPAGIRVQAAMNRILAAKAVIESEFGDRFSGNFFDRFEKALPKFKGRVISGDEPADLLRYIDGAEENLSDNRAKWAKAGKEWEQSVLPSIGKQELSEWLLRNVHHI